MKKNKNSDITEIFGPDFSKKARAYQKGREKEKTPEHLQWQKEAAVYLRISSEMQKEGFSLEAQMRDCTKYMVIFVPNGVDPEEDLTRNFSYYDGIYSYLQSCGIQEL